MNQKQKLTKILYKTITNIDVWQDVLKYLCEITGAPKGIIALREKENSELLVPQNVHIELQSPMLYGFLNEEIETYITEYYQFDPWTEIEKNHHPISPYAMSKYLSSQELKKTKFWQWLKPQKISDSVVVDIFSSANNWVSINLFFDGENEKIKNSALETLQENQFMMEEIWGLGLQFRVSKSSPESLIYFLEKHDSPSFLINSELKIIHKNKEAEKIYLDPKNPIKMSNNYLFTRKKEQLKNLKEAISGLSHQTFNVISPPHIKIQLDDWICSITLLNEGYNIVGEDTALHLISISPSSTTPNPNPSPIWETQGLTNREKELVEILALGGRVVDFQNKYGLTKSTAYTHWAHVKEKLLVVDRTDILLLHQNFLKTST